MKNKTKASHSILLSTPGREILDSKGVPPDAVIRHIPQVLALRSLSRV